MRFVRAIVAVVVRVVAVVVVVVVFAVALVMHWLGMQVVPAHSCKIQCVTT